MDKFPNYLQSANDTSAQTCLQILCKYYGVYRSPDFFSDLRRKRKFRNFSLLDTADYLGFRCKYQIIDIERLNIVRQPLIILSKNDHYVVLYKIKGENYHVSDPEQGLSVFNRNNLREKFNDLTKVEGWFFDPKPNFHFNDSREKQEVNFKYLFYYLRPYRKPLLQILLGFFSGAILSLFFPFMTQAIVDIGIPNANIDFIVLLLVGQIVLVFSQISIEFIRTWALTEVSLKVIITLISDFLHKLMRLPMGFFEQNLIGDLRQRMEDNARIQQFLTDKMVSMLFGLFMFLMYSIVMGIYSLKILLIFYVGSTLYLIWIFAFLKKRKVLDSKRFEQAVLDQNKVYEMFSGIQDIKMNGWEDRKKWDWERIQVNLFKISLQSLRISQYQNIGAISISQVMNISISFITATSVIKGEITLGAMFAIQFVVGQLNAPVNEFIQFVSSAQDTKLSLDRLRKINDELDENYEGATTYSLPSNHRIEIKNLNYGYSEGNLILKNINLVIPQGKITAIVGESGSGKTTLIKLLLKYYNASREEITIGDVSLGDFDIKEWRKICAAVMLEGVIFSDTIINNISPDHNGVSDENLNKAIYTSNIKSLIDELPLGLETPIGHGGINLSQGQKQRILIARAVFRNPKILFFDEATNALDSNNEKIISNRLREFFDGRTVVIVAHRLSTIKDADQIVVLDKGSIVEVGQHETLLKKKGYYFSLISNQL